jgi:RHS repeat-associated protein
LANNTRTRSPCARVGNTASSSYQVFYCGSYVYEKSGSLPIQLKRILLPEGSVETYVGNLTYISNWKYCYFLKDHQGNTRVALSKAIGSGSAVASGQVDYYPFGMEQSRNTVTSGGPLYSSDTPPYLYSGNELDKLNGLNQYDSHARWLDNAVPRFTTQDPLAELHYDESPYVYCGNDPVNRIDPLGLDWYWNSQTDKPAFFSGSANIKGYEHHGKTTSREDERYLYLYGESGSISKIDKLHIGISVDLASVYVTSNYSYLNYNVGYSYMDMMNAKAQREGQEDDAFKRSLSNINDGFSAAGTAAGGAELFTQANAGMRITYTTMNNTRAWVSTSKVVSTLKVAGNATYVGGILIDATLSSGGMQAWGKTAMNTIVGGVAIVVGGVPGLAIGAGYVALDKLGAFDGSAGLSLYKSPIEIVPDATYVHKTIVY